MTNSDIDIIKNYIAYGSVGASTVRGLKTKGVVKAARMALQQIDLKSYSHATESQFTNFLDSDTENVRIALPIGAQYWGVARKVLNIFLRNALYNIYLNRNYDLSYQEEYYEIPLDSISASGILNELSSQIKLQWCGVKHVKPDINLKFQNLATEIAKERNTLRIHLDAYFWGNR